MLDPEDRELDDEQTLIAYMRDLAVMERDGGERIPLVVGPFTAITMIGALQMATRHPELDPTTRRVLRDVVDQLAPAFAGTLGEEIINRGRHPEFDA